MRFRDWWDDYDTWGDSSLSNFDSFRRPRTSRLIDQHFGTALRRNDLLSSLANTHISTSPRTTSPYYRPWNVSNISRQDSGSTVNVEKDKFQIILDVQQFTPDEITYDIKNICVSTEINYLFCAVWKPTINSSSSRESTKKNKTSTDSFRGIFQSFPFMVSNLFDYLELDTSWESTDSQRTTSRRMFRPPCQATEFCRSRLPCLKSSNKPRIRI